MKSRSSRKSIPVFLFTVALVSGLFLGTTEAVAIQAKSEIVNGSMEEENSNLKGAPAGWVYSYRLKQQGYSILLDSEDPFEGKQSTLIDATEITSKDPRTFAQCNQYLDPKIYRGKRIRFRAAVKTAERSGSGRAQLWLRVDRKSNGRDPVIGAFDNMDSRPIQSDQWKHYDIVVDVDEDAERMTVGMLVFGKTKAWIDDVSLEVIDKEDAESTAMELGGAAQKGETNSKGKANSNGKANSTPANTQPFWTHWFWLVGFTLLFFSISQLGFGWRTGKESSAALNEQTAMSFIQKFAIKFSVVYWLFYCFPRPLFQITFGVIGSLEKLLNLFAGESEVPRTAKLLEWIGVAANWTKKTGESWVIWTGENVFGVQCEYFRTGSGDTTTGFIHVFMCFAVALIVGGIWSLVMIKRKTDHAWLNDGLRTYLRYFIAMNMLSYGLSKTGFIQTQFATGGMPGEYQLTRTFGDASPMGLLWTFMAASPAYTFFGGLGEVIGGVLIVFRRTATLGALVVFGVMLNVMMLNYCYDVPVKLFSTHLVVMSIFLLLPDLPRLANVLFFNRPTQGKVTLNPPYVGPRSIWFYRFIKAIIIFCVIVLPIYQHGKNEIENWESEKVESGHFLMDRGYRWINEYPLNR